MAEFASLLDLKSGLPQVLETDRMENQMEKKMENEMETGIIG